MRKLLLAVAIVLWIELWIGTAVAVNKGLPYGLGGHGHPNNVWGDFVGGGGTALSPPLFIVVLFTILIALATRRGWIRVIGVVGLTLLAALFVPTILAEPLVRRFLAPSHAAFPETVLVLISLVGVVLMFVLGVWNLVAAYRSRRAPAFGISSER